MFKCVWVSHDSHVYMYAYFFLLRPYFTPGSTVISSTQTLRARLAALTRKSTYIYLCSCLQGPIVLGVHPVEPSPPNTHSTNSFCNKYRMNLKLHRLLNVPKMPSTESSQPLGPLNLLPILSCENLELKRPSMTRPNPLASRSKILHVACIASAAPRGVREQRRKKGLPVEKLESSRMFKYLGAE